MVREWSKDGRSSDPPEQAEAPLRTQAALPQSVRINPKSLVIARAKLVNENEQALAERRAMGLVLAEPGEIKISGVWAARTISKVFASSKLVNESREHGRKDRGACPAESQRDGSWKSEPRAQLIAAAKRVTTESADMRIPGQKARKIA
jgi:hypothetical protein